MTPGGLAAGARIADETGTCVVSEDARARLGALLQLAYSGELAAALAYRGHAACVRDPSESAWIRRIEDEERAHRARLGEMLAELGLAPDPRRERRARRIGGTLGALCRVSGWLAPMYGAGRLESRNIREYETAARLARGCGREAWAEELLTMAEVEWDHEHWFRARVLSHPLGRRLPLWPEPPPRASLREGGAGPSPLSFEAVGTPSRETRAP